MRRFRLSRFGIVVVGLSGLSILALCVAIVAELMAGPFDKCPVPIYTPAQNITLGACIGTVAVLPLGLVVAMIGRIKRRDVVVMTLAYAAAGVLFVAAVLLYRSHPAFECP